jgi:hypothetical protein
MFCGTLVVGGSDGLDEDTEENCLLDGLRDGLPMLGLNGRALGLRAINAAW